MSYELLDKSECAICIISIKRITESGVVFTIWEVTSWDGETNEPYEKDFVAEVYWKYDNCTHWNFYGMDYDPETDEEKDSYYHICGSFFMTRWMIMFAFARKVITEILGDTTQDYRDFDKELDNQLLKEYTIRKVE